MSFALYAAVVPGQVQMLGALVGVLDKAAIHADAIGLPRDELLQARLAADMFPLARQLELTVAQSVGAIEGLRRGSFEPALGPLQTSFERARDAVAQALAFMRALDPGEIDGLVGRMMRFNGRKAQLDYLAEDYVFSFSQPNFFFHVVTAYDILRHQGVPLGKADFLGRLRTSPRAAEAT